MASVEVADDCVAAFAKADWKAPSPRDSARAARIPRFEPK